MGIFYAYTFSEPLSICLPKFIQKEINIGRHTTDVAFNTLYKFINADEHTAAPYTSYCHSTHTDTGHRIMQTHGNTREVDDISVVKQTA